MTMYMLQLTWTIRQGEKWREIRVVICDTSFVQYWTVWHNLTQFGPKSDHDIPVFDRVAAVGVVDDCAESKKRKPFFT